MYGERLSPEAVRNQVDRLMKKFDQDNNGKLTETEFVEGCLKDEELRKFFYPIMNS